MHDQTHPIDELDASRAILVQNIEAMRTRLRELPINPAYIVEIRKEADQLAAIFKPMVQEAVDAYASGAKELAHEIAVNRRRIQAECEALNAQANALRDEPVTLPKAITEAEHKLSELGEQLALLEPLRHIAISGFEQAYGVNVRVISEELAKLSPALVQRIQQVTYEHQLQSDFAAGRTARKANNPEQTAITLYPILASLDPVTLERDYRHTVTHEAGHVLFDWVITAEQRFVWGNLYNQTLRDDKEFITPYASESLREDFGECFMMYIHDPQQLREHDTIRYNYIDSIYKEISQ